VVVEGESESISPFDLGPFQQRGQGSGFIIDREGHILTNNHVVDNTSSVRIVLHDGDVLDAEVLGTDRENDLALLKTDPKNLGEIDALSLGDSDEIKPGQMAIALGSPFGLEGSITVGVISGTGRSLPSEAQRLITDIIQTDAAINPGNSGGPLLNSKGEVIGINTAIEVSATRIGFAIPINTAKSLLPALLEGGEVSSPWLGIKGMAINKELSDKLELPVDNGVYVIEVTPDSPAARAGLRGSGTDEGGDPTYGGDIIVDVDGQLVTEVEDLISYFNSKKPGDNISLTIYRGENTLSIELTLGEWPAQIR
jgi:2-alkenal reductase